MQAYNQESDNRGERLFTIKELVDQLGVLEWYWRSQVWLGRLPYVQAGRKILIDHQDIEAVIEGKKNAIWRNKTRGSTPKNYRLST